jgi:hypothetical protein
MKRTTVRKRCTECGSWFRPLARLAKQQRVCSERCRLARRGRHARARRALDPVRHREEERERKRQSRQAAQKRAAVTEPGTAVSACHAPGEASKQRESQKEFDQIWDKLIDLSRAAWERELRRIAREIWRKSRHGPGAGEGWSRTG